MTYGHRGRTAIYDHDGYPIVDLADVYESPAEQEATRKRHAAEDADRAARRAAGEYVPSRIVTFQGMWVTNPLLTAGWVCDATPVREERHASPDVDPRFGRPFVQVTAVYRITPRVHGRDDPWAPTDPKPWDPDAAAAVYADLAPTDKSGSASRREARVVDGILWVKASWVTTGGWFE